MHEQRGTWYAAHLPIVNKLGATEALSHHNTHYRRQPAAAKSVCQPANNRVHLRLRGGAVAAFAPEMPLGKALFDAKVSEPRVAKVLNTSLSQRRDALMRLARLLARTGKGVDTVDLTRLLLALAGTSKHPSVQQNNSVDSALCDLGSWRASRR